MARSPMKLVLVQCLSKSEQVQFLKNTDTEPLNDCHKAQYPLIEGQALSLRSNGTVLSMNDLHMVRHLTDPLVPFPMYSETVRCLLAPCLANLVPVPLMYGLRTALHLTDPLVLSLLLKPVLCLMGTRLELFLCPTQWGLFLCPTQSGLVRLRLGKKMPTRNPRESNKQPWSMTATPLRWA